MADLPRRPGADPEPGLGSVHGAPGKPKWGAVAAIIVRVGFVALFVILHLTGAIGPGGH